MYNVKVTTLLCYYEHPSIKIQLVSIVKSWKKSYTFLLRISLFFKGKCFLSYPSHRKRVITQNYCI